MQGALPKKPMASGEITYPNGIGQQRQKACINPTEVGFAVQLAQVVSEAIAERLKK